MCCTKGEPISIDSEDSGKIYQNSLMFRAAKTFGRHKCFTFLQKCFIAGAADKWTLPVMHRSYICEFNMATTVLTAATLNLVMTSAVVILGLVMTSSAVLLGLVMTSAAVILGLVMTSSAVILRVASADLVLGGNGGGIEVGLFNTGGSDSDIKRGINTGGCLTKLITSIFAS